MLRARALSTVVGGCVMALALAVMTGCLWQPLTHGSGHVRVEVRHLHGFTAVELRGVGILDLTQTGQESVRITTDDNILPLITSTVTSGVLQLSVKPHVSIEPTRLVYAVTVRELKTLRIEGAARAVADRLVGTSLDVSGAGSVHITASGQDDSQRISLSGAGVYDGSNLQTAATTVAINGAGSATVAASRSLSVQVTGTGSVGYIGDPTITRQEITGAGSVRRLR